MLTDKEPHRMHSSNDIIVAKPGSKLLTELFDDACMVFRTAQWPFKTPRPMKNDTDTHEVRFDWLLANLIGAKQAQFSSYEQFKRHYRMQTLPQSVVLEV